MTLKFPNPNRSFDEVRNAVCFIGQDGMCEVPFFVEVTALNRSSVGLRTAPRSVRSAEEAGRWRHDRRRPQR